jgi:hypothetical protein
MVAVDAPMAMGLVVQAAAKRRLLLLPLGPNSDQHTAVVVTPIVGNEMNTRRTSFGR